MRNMHIFDAIQHTYPKTFSRSCEIDVDHNRTPEAALCDARLRSPGTVTPGMQYAIQQYRALRGRTALSHSRIDTH